MNEQYLAAVAGEAEGSDSGGDSSERRGLGDLVEDGDASLGNDGSDNTTAVVPAVTVVPVVAPENVVGDGGDELDSGGDGSGDLDGAAAREADVAGGADDGAAHGDEGGGEGGGVGVGDGVDDFSDLGAVVGGDDGIGDDAVADEASVAVASGDGEVAVGSESKETVAEDGSNTSA